MVEGPLPAPKLRKFQAQTRHALLQLLHAPEYTTVWCNFVETFEFRRQFPWLDESGRREREGDGLVAALRDALEVYDSADLLEEAGETKGAGETPVRTQLSPQQTQQRHPLPATWVDRLAAATLQVTREYATMQGFARALAWGGVELDQVTPDVLRAHLVRALESYAEQREIGVFRAPF